MAFVAIVQGSGPLTYTWAFGGAGDATAETTCTPSYLYDAPGTYTVTVHVEGPYNADTLARQVEVTRRTSAGVALTAMPAAQAVGGLVDLFARLFDNLGDPVGEGYAVTFSVSPIGVFASGGQTATVHTDASGQAETTLTSAEPGTARVTAEAPTGVEDSVDVVFYEPVEITGLSSNSPVLFGDALVFTASVAGTGPLTYTWDFSGAGNGSDQGTANPSYVYDEAGLYTVTLMVESPYDSDQATHLIQVRRRPSTLVLEAASLAAALGETIDLEAALLDDVGDPLGEGYDVMFNVSPIGHFPGSGTSIFVSTDGQGQADAELTSNEVGIATVVAQAENGVLDTVEIQFYEPAEIETIATNSPVGAGQTVVFTPTVKGTGPMTYAWAFGGDPMVTGSGTSAPTVTYGEAGTYTVTLTVSSPYDVDVKAIEVSVLHRVYLPTIDREGGP